MTKTEWLQERRIKSYSWCTDDQWECCQMIFDLIGGEHHLYGKIKPYAKGIEYNTNNSRFATYDFNGLTTAVFMAHDRMIRFAINPSGPGLIRLCLWKRHAREGGFISERHPTINTALAKYRETYKKPEA